MAKADLSQPNRRGCAGRVPANLVRVTSTTCRTASACRWCVAINAFPADTAEEHGRTLSEVCAEAGRALRPERGVRQGRRGRQGPGRDRCWPGPGGSRPRSSTPTRWRCPVEAEKVAAVAKKIYRAGGVSFSAAASKTLAELTALGYGDLPVCIAKTQYCFQRQRQADRRARPASRMEVREVRLCRRCRVSWWWSAAAS